MKVFASFELKRFGENTSIRGVPRIFKSRDTFMKVVWSIAVLLCTLALIFMMVTIFGKFYEWPIATKFGEDSAGKIVFPDVTVCSLNRFLNDLNDSESIHEYFDLFDNELDKNATQLFNFFNTFSAYALNYPKNSILKNDDCPDFVVQCLVYNENWQSVLECKKNFIEIWNGDYYKCQILRTSSLNIDKELAIRGITLVLNIGEQIKLHLPHNFTLTSSQALGAVITIHSPGTPPDMKTGITFGPGTEGIIKISQTKVERLDVPYNIDGCTDQTTLKNSPQSAYSFDMCREHCWQNLIYESCNCTVHWYDRPDSLEETTFCGNITGLINSSSIDDIRKKVLCSLNFYPDEKRCKQCKQPCNEISYKFTATSSPWPPLSFQLSVYRNYIKACVDQFPKVKERYVAYEYFDNRKTSSGYSNQTFRFSDLKEIGESLISLKLVMENENPFLLQDKPKYTWDVMISLIGGMFSLWLGISAMTIFEIFEFFYHLVKSRTRTESVTLE